MRFQSQVKVLGMKASKGTLDDGKTYDSTKVYVETALDESKGNAKGFAVAEYGFSTAGEFDRYKHLPFPVICDAVFELVTTGKVQMTKLVELKPREMAQPAKG